MKPEDIHHIVVHCSKTSVREGDGLPAVERKCRKRGALSCGYHYIIARDGSVQTGRSLDEAGNHLLGHNGTSLAICVVGMPGRITGPQRKALGTLLAILRERFPSAKQVTHAELDRRSGADCPGFKLSSITKGD